MEAHQKNPHRAWFVLSLLVCFVTWISGCASSLNSSSRIESAVGGEMVEAEGMAPMTGDLLATKKASLADAQRVAVEKVVGVLVSGKTLVEKAITVEQNILAKSAGYVKKYEVIKEWEGSGHYHTRIKAFVSSQRIGADLDTLALLRSPVVGNPRIAILIKETNLSNTLSQGLTKYGYKVVTHPDAEIIITGEVSSTPVTSSALGGFISLRGILAARALNHTTGEILTAVSTQASGIGITEEAAYQKTMTLLGEKAAEEFVESLSAHLVSRLSISLTAREVSSFENLVKLRDILTGIEGINDMFVRSYSGDVAEIEINTNSVTSVDVATTLSKNGWRVIRQTHNALEIKTKGLK